MSHAYEEAYERLDKTHHLAGHEDLQAWDILSVAKEVVEALHEEVQELRAEVERLKGLHEADTRHGRDIHYDEEEY